VMSHRYAMDRQKRLEVVFEPHRDRGVRRAGSSRPGHLRASGTWRARPTVTPKLRNRIVPQAPHISIRHPRPISLSESSRRTEIRLADEHPHEEGPRAGQAMSGKTTRKSSRTSSRILGFRDFSVTPA
jgi:hypothetical protein